MKRNFKFGYMFLFAVVLVISLTAAALAADDCVHEWGEWVIENPVTCI